jgi:hypothetical protein
VALSRPGRLPTFRIKLNTALIAAVEGSAKRPQHNFIVKPTATGTVKVLAAAPRTRDRVFVLGGNLHLIYISEAQFDYPATLLIQSSRVC